MKLLNFLKTHKKTTAAILTILLIIIIGASGSGGDTNVPTDTAQENSEPSEFAKTVYQDYWDVLNEEGNPRGYINHPTTLSATNDWEKVKIDEIKEKYDLSYDELFDIVVEVTVWNLK